MHSLFQFLIRFGLILTLVSFAFAQDNPPANGQRTSLTVSASASADRVRFSAPSSVVQLRLEVYNTSGRKLFDNELRGGNVLDWHLRDGQAEPLADGAYLCVVTVKSLSGKLTQTIASVLVEKSIATIQATNASQMTPQQAETIGPVEENAALTVMKEAEHPATTVVAHNGEDGQIIRGQGALSFRLGDFFSGKDSEQMRLTAEGNLGIGISQPQARLDVDGFVRATQGIVFPDGSVQFSASRKTFGPLSQRPGQFQQKLAQGQEHLLPDISGTGTTGKIPKWLDGPNGVLGDSLITEANGNIGINTTPDPRFKLDVLGFNRFRAPNASFYLSGFKPGGNDWVYQTVDDDGRFRIWGGDNTTGAERVTIKLDTGNVGIGVTNPIARLAVSTPSVTSGNNTAYFQAPNIGPHASNIHFGTTGDWYIRSASASGKVILQDTGGKVGIGTNSPSTAKLQVFDDSIGAAVHGTSAVSGGGFTVGGIGVLGETQTADGVGVYGRNLFGGFAMYAEGNTSQLRNKGGWVKALLKVSDVGGTERCYNGITGSAGGTCGFSVSLGPNIGQYDINFGFKADDRFAVVTMDSSGFTNSATLIYGFGNANTIRVITCCSYGFTIIVY